MRETSSDFITKFHNIKGLKIRERKKCLFMLLKNTSFSTTDEQLILNNLIPKTYLENVFYIDILIYLRKTQKLWEIMKTGNELLISKIMKQPWFFQEMFHNISAEEIVEDVLPNISFTFKRKVLIKISFVLTKDRVDQLFDSVLKRYGFCMASTLISTCSAEKIDYILNNYELKLGSNQLKLIYNTQPSLIIKYLNQRKGIEQEGLCYNGFFTFVAQQNPTFFWELTMQYKFKDTLRLGRRTTKKIIKAKRQEVINQPKKIFQYLRHEALVKQLNSRGDFRQFFYNWFPKSIESLNDNFMATRDLLMFYPKRHRYNLFKETFQNIWKDDIWNYAVVFDTLLLEIIPDRHDQLKWALFMYRDTNDIEIVKYYKVKDCIDIITQKINASRSTKERSKLLCILVKCCAINKDLNGLEKVLEYFTKIYHKDDLTRGYFLDIIECSFIRNSFNIKDCNEAQWKYINKIFAEQNAREEFCSIFSAQLRIRYIEYLNKYDKNIDKIKKAISDYVIAQVRSYSLRMFLLHDLKNRKLEKKILLYIPEFLLTTVENKVDTDSQKNYFLSEYMAEIFCYNRRYLKDEIVISENELLAKIFIRVLKNGYVSHSFKRNLVHAVCKLNRNAFENEVLMLYWKSFSEERVISWYLKHDPWTIVDHFDILRSALLTMGNILSKLKMYSYLGLDKTMEKYCLNQMENEASENKIGFIRPLSFVSTPEKYIKVMETYIYSAPSSAFQSLDKREKEREKIYIFKLQREFLKNLTNFSDPLTILPVLFQKMCILSSVSGTLFRFFYKTPETLLRYYLTQLLDYKAISVKKIGVFLVCKIFDTVSVIQTFKSLREEKINHQLYPVLFSNCFKYFINNPSQDLFEELIILLKFLRKKNSDILEDLATLKVPQKYMSPYVQNIWKLLETFEQNGEDEFNTVINIKYALLRSIDGLSIQQLPQEFKKNIIQKNFLCCENKEDSPDVLSFLIQFLMEHDNLKANNDYVFGILYNYKIKFWKDNTKVLSRRRIYHFFKAFYKVAYEKQVHLDVIIMFLNNWNNIFTPFEAFEEYVLINLLLFEKETKEPQLVTYAKKIVLFSEQIIKEFGSIIIPKFVVSLEKSFHFNDHEIITLLFNMLQYKTSSLSGLIVLEIIICRGDFFYKNKVSQKYHEIISLFRDMTDPNIELYYQLLLKQNM